MSEMSSEQIEETPRRTIDNLHRSRSARVLAPILALATFISLVVVVVTKGDAQEIVNAAILFVGAALLLIRIHRPMHTWPEWLFSYKP
jgi:hypothetical protein